VKSTNDPVLIISDLEELKPCLINIMRGGWWLGVVVNWCLRTHRLLSAWPTYLTISLIGATVPFFRMQFNEKKKHPKSISNTDTWLEKLSGHRQSRSAAAYNITYRYQSSLGILLYDRDKSKQMDILKLNSIIIVTMHTKNYCERRRCVGLHFKEYFIINLGTYIKSTIIGR